MAQRPRNTLPATIPAPATLQAVEAKPDGVLLRWEHAGGADILFVIEWSRGGKFYGVEETDGTFIDGKRRTYEFLEPLPTSGVSQYRVRAVRNADPWDKSEPSNVVTVSINGPAAGDV